MALKSYFLLSALSAMLMCPGAVCQIPESEPVHIPEVIITESNSKFFSEDQTTISVGNSSFPLSKQQNLGAVLDYESPALVRSYGSPGSLISLSLHGTGSNHASVSWNGFPINSPSTGQADLSLIPFGFMQSVDIVHGASGALNGSGTFGGLIELINEPDWNKRIAFSASATWASFHTRGHFLSLQTGGNRLQYHMALIDNQSRNDFTYVDAYRAGSPEIQAEHNAYKSRGMIQNLYLNAGNGNYFEAGAWFQHKMKEIPALMGSYGESNAMQEDRNFRTYLNYRRSFINSSLLVKTAYFTDFLHYTDKLNVTDENYSLNSKMNTGSMMNAIEYRHHISRVITAGAGGSFIHNRAVTNNYNDDIIENEFAIYGNLKIRLADWIINTSVRQEFYEGTDPVLQYSLGIRVKVTEKLIFRSNFSSKFRKPTLNEKYWKPGGNTGLKPEKGWGGDMAAELLILHDDDKGTDLSAVLTGYYQGIDNWIQWIVRDSLTPVEYKRVHVRGTEAVINFLFPAGFASVSGNISYGCNYATISETYDEREGLTGNQLIYIPRHVARMNLIIRYREISIGCHGSLTGSRETVERADPYFRLPAYGLIDLFSGYEREFKNIRAGIHFKIENLLNKQYEAIRAYAMPGRTFQITVALDFN
ncbi:MAG: TonB-dependent receptor [Bacteroidales bacterium]|nr:TonB-dependent receptor [Bacteroidales bacterium]